MRPISFCLTTLLAVGCGNSFKDEQCAKNRATTSVDFVCSSDDDCCSGWKCIDHSRNDGKVICGLPCASNSDCTLAAGSTSVRKYCNSYSFATICDSIPPGIGGSGGGNCCGDGFCCPMDAALCCGSPALGTVGVCCPHNFSSRGVGTCDLDPPCYSGDAEATQHCSGVNYNGQVVYSELCTGT